MFSTTAYGGSRVERKELVRVRAYNEAGEAPKFQNRYAGKNIRAPYFTETLPCHQLMSSEITDRRRIADKTSSVERWSRAGAVT